LKFLSKTKNSRDSVIDFYKKDLGSCLAAQSCKSSELAKVQAEKLTLTTWRVDFRGTYSGFKTKN
jgi:hypothetical protein